MALDINSNTLVVLAGGRRLESDILLALRLCKKIAIDDVSLALVVQLQAAATLRGSETETKTSICGIRHPINIKKCKHNRNRLLKKRDPPDADLNTTATIR